MPERDLYEHAIRTIGLKKFGKLIRLRFESALARAVREGWLSVTDGAVRLAR